MATLTYVYAESTAVVGPLAARREPHAYDLCRTHALSLTAPRGWRLVRPETELPDPPVVDDLAVLVEAVWSSSDGDTATDASPAARGRPPGDADGRTRRGPGRGHLRPVPPA